ncbi:MAG: ABC transporter ATP-binding protein [Bacillota bacterium]
MLKVDGIQTYYGNVQALYSVSLTVEQGELVSLIGANGAGKSTTLKSICGLKPPAKGTIEFCGERTDTLRAFDVVKRGIVLCPEGRHVFPELTVYENLLMGAFTRKDNKGIQEDVEKVYGLFPILKERQKQLAGTFSGGQQQMLAIARALMARPRLLLLDEPSLGLAPVVIQDIAKIIRDINAGGMAVLLVEQNARLALSLAHRAYVLENGKVCLSGASHELMRNPEVNRLYLGG